MASDHPTDDSEAETGHFGDGLQKLGSAIAKAHPLVDKDGDPDER